MKPTSTKLTSLVNNWLTQASVKEKLFFTGIRIKMSADDVSDFLTRVLREQDFDFHNPEEVIYWYCYFRQYGYHKAEELKKSMHSWNRIKIIQKLPVCLPEVCVLIQKRNFFSTWHMSKPEPMILCQKKVRLFRNSKGF